MTSPWLFNSGPPEFPGLMAASVWISSSFLSYIPNCVTFLFRLLIIPRVTVFSNPKGFPTAIARQPGFGFGLGFARTIDPAQNGVIGNDSIYFWMGAASTTFWVDPKADIGVIYLTQSILAGLPTANDLKALIYPAIMD